jgi:hypothetical protein
MGREDFLEKVVFDMTYILCNEKETICHMVNKLTPGG